MYAKSWRRGGGNRIGNAGNPCAKPFRKVGAGGRLAQGWPTKDAAELGMFINLVTIFRAQFSADPVTREKQA